MIVEEFVPFAHCGARSHAGVIVRAEQESAPLEPHGQQGSERLGDRLVCTERTLAAEGSAQSVGDLTAAFTVSSIAFRRSSNIAGSILLCAALSAPADAANAARAASSAAASDTPSPLPYCSTAVLSLVVCWADD